ncbi:hypothetical protein ACWXWL_23985, partial [Pantoea ananatis]
MKKEVRFLENHCHGLRWGSGHIPLEDFELEVSRILQPFSCVFVRGAEKRKALSFLNKPIYDLEELMNCPPLHVLKKQIAAFR